VKGGHIYGRMPLMTNYANFNATREDYADNRGVMLPGTSLSQCGATLAKWFGASDADLDSIFPTLPSFGNRDVGVLVWPRPTREAAWRGGCSYCPSAVRWRVTSARARESSKSDAGRWSAPLRAGGR
jgi:hypothetical protein